MLFGIEPKHRYILYALMNCRSKESVRMVIFCKVYSLKTACAGLRFRVRNYVNYRKDLCRLDVKDRSKNYENEFFHQKLRLWNQ
ncbi:unnamed protein product [Rhizophagus irregularis]|uniref:Uncharacterized protein n=1 Tax=Rhizophagus irregularis TaxID=588596 RepID=A0A915ZQG7_9GLOM|nr:unnamed protein product [Rhizophagus irregularis]